jgi:hypothetical protein
VSAGITNTWPLEFPCRIDEAVATSSATDRPADCGRTAGVKS